MRNNCNGLREQQGFYEYEGTDTSAYKRQVLQTFLNRIETSGLKPEFNIANQA